MSVELMRTLLLLAEEPHPNDTPEARLGTLIVGVVGGLWLLIVGVRDIRRGTAEESGSRRWVNKVRGASSTYTGGRAAFLSWARVIGGVALIILGVLVYVYGPLLPA
jgi:hypothetical protein